MHSTLMEQSKSMHSDHSAVAARSKSGSTNVQQYRTHIFFCSPSIILVNYYKMNEICYFTIHTHTRSLARSLTAEEKKCVIWNKIFTINKSKFRLFTTINKQTRIRMRVRIVEITKHIQVWCDSLWSRGWSSNSQIQPKIDLTKKNEMISNR